MNKSKYKIGMNKVIKEIHQYKKVLSKNNNIAIITKSKIQNRKVTAFGGDHGHFVGDSTGLV